MAYSTIEIDLELHKLIEARRQSFGETPCDILLRLCVGKVASKPTVLPESNSNNQQKSWFGGGVELPHKTMLRMVHNGRKFEAQIMDGFWVVEGEHYNAPSPAAYAVARTKAGHPAHINGWIYWEVKMPGDRGWQWLSELRTPAT